MFSYKEFFLLEKLQNEVFIGDKEIEKLETELNSGKKDKSDLSDLVNKIHDNYSGFYDKVEKKLISMIKHLIYKDKKVKLYTNKKPIESIIDKAKLREKKDIRLSMI